MKPPRIHKKLWSLEYQMVCGICRDFGFPKPSEARARQNIHKFRDYVDRHDPRIFGYPGEFDGQGVAV